MSRGVLRHGAELGVVALGMLCPLGYLAGVPALVLAGRLSAASPFPMVFGAVGGHEYWASRYEMDVETRSGARTRLVAGGRDVARLGGPHRARMLVVLPLVLAPALPDAAWMPPMARAWCDGGMLAQHFAVHEPVRRVDFLAAHAAGAERGERHYTLWCRR